MENSFSTLLSNNTINENNLMINFIFHENLSATTEILQMRNMFILP